jgi:FdhD protein
LRVGAAPATVARHGDGAAAAGDDLVAVEEPLELRVLVADDAGARATRTIAATMRTPGSDEELALGFLLAEGVITGGNDVWDVSRCLEPVVAPGVSAGPAPGAGTQQGNVLTITLADGCRPDLHGLDRHFFQSSACGVCGGAGIERLAARCRPVASDAVFDGRLLRGLPDRLRPHQALFAATGGLHAAALISADGEVLVVREDVGRHNAVDKVVGWAVRADRLPLDAALLLVSGRASFEIVQKALVAGVAAVAAVSAPTSLAVETAQAFGLTLVGFLRAGGFNVYSGPQRVTRAGGAAPNLADC